MQRRNFIRGFVGAIAAAAVSARLVAQEPEIRIPEGHGTLRNLFANRYTCENGEWRQVQPYIRQGDCVVLNPDYIDAPYEDLIILAKDGQPSHVLRHVLIPTRTDGA